MSTVVTFNSPNQLKNYLNNITLPAVYDVIDKGARFTVIDELGANSYAVTTVFDEARLILALDGVTNLIGVVPKKEGGKLTFFTEETVVGGINGFAMTIVRDQKQLEDALNDLIDVGLAIDFVAEHGTKKLIFTSPWDPDARVIFDRMPALLLAAEQIAINDFVIAEKAAGNWGLYDDFFCFGLQDEINALTGFLAFDAINLNDSPYLGGSGFDLTGGNRIEVQYNPTNDGVNYTLDDCMAGVLIAAGQVLDPTGFALFDTLAGTGRMRLLQDADILKYNINDTATSFGGQLLASGKYYLNVRLASNSRKIYEDGIEIESTANASVALPDNVFTIRCRDGVVQSFAVGAGIGFDVVANNTNVRALLTALAAI